MTPRSALDVATDAKLQILERAILLENKGTGIGFVFGGKVLDKTTLSKIFVAMGGFLGTVVPLFWAVRSSGLKPTVAGTEACALSGQEELSIRAAMASRNASCSYSMSVNSVFN